MYISEILTKILAVVCAFCILALVSCFWYTMIERGLVYDKNIKRSQKTVQWKGLWSACNYCSEGAEASHRILCTATRGICQRSYKQAFAGWNGPFCARMEECRSKARKQVRNTNTYKTSTSWIKTKGAIIHRFRCIASFFHAGGCVPGKRKIILFIPLWVWQNAINRILRCYIHND